MDYEIKLYLATHQVASVNTVVDMILVAKDLVKINEGKVNLHQLSATDVNLTGALIYQSSSVGRADASYA